MTTLDFKTRCSRCLAKSVGRLHFDERMTLRDSDGGLLFVTGWVCHVCLDEVWDSGDATYGKPRR